MRRINSADKAKKCARFFQCTLLVDQTQVGFQLGRGLKRLAGIPRRM
jgi:hypothetical protein